MPPSPLTNPDHACAVCSPSLRSTALTFSPRLCSTELGLTASLSGGWWTSRLTCDADCSGPAGGLWRTWCLCHADRATTLCRARSWGVGCLHARRALPPTVLRFPCAGAKACSHRRCLVLVCGDHPPPQHAHPCAYAGAARGPRWPPRLSPPPPRRCPRPHPQGRPCEAATSTSSGRVRVALCDQRRHRARAVAVAGQPGGRWRRRAHAAPATGDPGLPGCAGEWGHAQGSHSSRGVADSLGSGRCGGKGSGCGCQCGSAGHVLGTRLQDEAATKPAVFPTDSEAFASSRAVLSRKHAQTHNPPPHPPSPQTHTAVSSGSRAFREFVQGSHKSLPPHCRQRPCAALLKRMYCVKNEPAAGGGGRKTHLKHDSIQHHTKALHDVQRHQ
jgi:hypothetical protein